MLSLPTVTRVIEGAGLTDYSRVNPDTLKKTAHFGTAAHLATVLYDKGILNKKTLDPDLIPYLDSWIKYRTDTGLVIIAIEPEIISQKYGIIGHPDRIVMLYGRKTVIELKSTATLLPTTAIQTAGYKGIYDEGKPIQDKIKDRVGVLLTATGIPKVKPYKEKDDWSVFLACLSVANWKVKSKI